MATMFRARAFVPWSILFAAFVQLGAGIPALAQTATALTNYRQVTLSGNPISRVYGSSDYDKEYDLAIDTDANGVWVLKIADFNFGSNFVHKDSFIELPAGAKPRDAIPLEPGTYAVLEPGIGKLAIVDVFSGIKAQVTIPGLTVSSPSGMTYDRGFGRLYISVGSGEVVQVNLFGANLAAAARGGRLRDLAGTPSVTTFVMPLPAGAAGPPSPLSLVMGPDGNVWFTETPATNSAGVPIFNGTENIGRMTPAGGFTQFAVPSRFAGTGDRNTSIGSYLVVGSDGNIWFTEESVAKIGRITPAGTITEFLLPAGASTLFGITAGPDGNLWIKDFAGKIYRMSVTGSVTTFVIPTKNFGSDKELIVGPDGALWFLEDNKVGRITVTGEITEFALPTATDGSPIYPFQLDLKNDGTARLIEYSTNKLGYFAIAPAVSAAASGPLARRVLNVTLRAFPADVGIVNQVFVAAKLQNQYYFRTASGWQLWDGGVIPVYSTVALPSQLVIPVLDGSFDVSGVVGAQIYVGYGTDAATMLSHSRYALAYTLQ